MPLHARCEPILRRFHASGWTDPETMTIQQARLASAEQSAPFRGPAAAVAGVRRVAAPGPGGAVPARLYRPHDVQGPGVLVWFHGGGFALGSLESCDVLARALARASSSIVLSVDYRLAPEYPFPSGLEDCYAATRWAAEHAHELGAPGDRVAIGGESAGANLAAAVSLLARERGDVRPALQVLTYPMTCRAADGLPSRTGVSGASWPTPDGIDWLWDLYLAGHDPADGLASPLLAASLDGLPPALVLTAEYDTLRDEAERYAMRLIEAGVPVETCRYEGMLHGFLDFGGVPELAQIADEAIARVGRAVRRALDDARRADLREPVGPLRVAKPSGAAR
ncbi:MAG: acetyl esterase [Solirubrobacteraceae bacterium]